MPTMSPPNNSRETRRCVRRCRQDYTAAMATRDDGRAVLRPRISPHKSADPTVPTDQQVASHLVVQAARRLEIVSSVALVAVLLLWLSRQLLRRRDCERARIASRVGAADRRAHVICRHAADC